MTELWKIVEGYEKYEISNLGNVRKRLKPYTNQEGYKTIGLVDENGKRKDFRVHRLVANAFIPKIDNKSLVNHIDGIKDNNVITNLEWCTAKENTQHSIKIGTFRTKHHSFSLEQKKQIFDMIKNGERISDVSKTFNNITVSSIHYILENDFSIKDVSKLIDQSRHRHSLSERKRIKKVILESGKSNSDISKEVGISQQLVSKIKRNIEWKDIKIDCKVVYSYAPTSGKTNDQLIYIKNDILNSGKAIKELSEKHNLSPKTIRNIKSEKTWKLVPIINKSPLS